MDCKNTQPKNPCHFSKGFTLVELLVVIAIVAVLATLASFGAGRAMEKGRQTQALTQLDTDGDGKLSASELSAAIDAFRTAGAYVQATSASAQTAVTA